MSSDRSTDGCPEGTQSYGIDYRIAQSVLESIVRGVVAADPAVQVHQGSRLGRGKVVDVVVTGSSCRVALALDAHLGDALSTVASVLQQRVTETLEGTTGLTVEGVDLTIVSVMPAHESP